MRERLGLAEETHRAGLDEMSLNVIASPLQEIRGLLRPDGHRHRRGLGRPSAGGSAASPTPSPAGRRACSAPSAKGNIAPRRQVEACIQQCADLVADDGYFAKLVEDARLTVNADPGELADVDQGRAGHAPPRPRRLPTPSWARWLKDHLLDDAPEADACGAERYALLSRSFLGAGVDLAETYAWGQQEVARITAEMEQVAEQIKPGSTVKEAIAALDADPAYQLHGTDELKAWMQKRADEAIANLAGTHFDIPDPVRTIECLIAPTQTGGIYYTGPVRGLHPTGPDVVVGAQGRDRVRHLEGAHHRLPRGRPRASPPGRADGLPVRAAQQVAADRAPGPRVTARAGRCMPSG